MKLQKIVITGAAGLVGQNLLFELEKQYDVVALDKHKYNLNILHKHHPNVKAVYADLAERGEWEREFKDTDILILLHARITAKTKEPFVRDNVIATQLVLDAAKKYKVKYIIHVSSSVVISVANDDYTNTKKEFGIPYVVLRPPLMFGWFDKKHLGWLSRFMKKVPIFPIPGDGKYLRQPLFVRDFCKVIVACVKQTPNNEILEIMGREKINYIDIMKTIKSVNGSLAIILPLPFWFFASIIRIYGWISPNPQFTPDQLQALVAGDKFKVHNWWTRFNIKSTPFKEAMVITHQGKYAKVICKE